MEDLKCISFDNDIELSKDTDISYVKIKVGNKEFGVCIDEDEVESEYKKYNHFADCQFSTINVITSLKKLTKLLEASINVYIAKSLIE